MLYRVAGDPKIGYDLGVGTGTYGGYVRWVRALLPVRYGGTVQGYGMGVPHFGNSTTFLENRYGGYTAPVRRTPVPFWK